VRGRVDRLEKRLDDTHLQQFLNTETPTSQIV